MDPGGRARRRHRGHGMMGQGRWQGLGWICHLPRAVPLIHAPTGFGIQYLYVNTASRPPASVPAQSRAPSWAWMYPVPPGPVSTATSCGGQTVNTRQRTAYVLTCLICLLWVLFIDANASKPVVRSFGFPRFSWTHSKSHSQVLTPPALVWQVLFTIRERVITFARCGPAEASAASIPVVSVVLPRAATKTTVAMAHARHRHWGINRAFTSVLHSSRLTAAPPPGACGPRCARPVARE